MTNALVLYMPAVHQGYIKLFEQQVGDIYLLGEGMIGELPRLDRDIRAVKPKQIQAMLAAVYPDRRIDIIQTAADVDKLQSYGSIALPLEDISRVFAENHLVKIKHEFINIFLRWDNIAAVNQYQPPMDRKVSVQARDKELMGLAFKDATSSPDWWRQVGAVIAVDGEPVLVGHNRPLASTDYTLDAFGDPRANFNAGQHIEISKAIHGEAGLIAEAAKRGLKLEGASIYASTFPCPNCAKLIAIAGIKHVYYTEGYSLLDANDIFAEFGIEAIYVEQEKSPSA